MSDSFDLMVNSLPTVAVAGLLLHFVIRRAVLSALREHDKPKPQALTSPTIVTGRLPETGKDDPFHWG